MQYYLMLCCAMSGALDFNKIYNVLPNHIFFIRKLSKAYPDT